MIRTRLTAKSRGYLTTTVSSSRTAVVCGLLNRRSIAWGCVEALLERQFDVLVTCQNDRILKANQSLFSTRKIKGVVCNVTCDESLQALFQQDQVCDFMQDRPLDALVHSLAYAPMEAMKGPNASLLNTTRQDFFLTCDVSAYSLIALTKHALPYLLKASSPSITALTYVGSQLAVPNYNVMGPAKAALESIVRGLALELGPQNVRVNAVSAGPIATVAAKGGIRNFTEMQTHVVQHSPLRQNVTIKQVGQLVANLTDLHGITGQTIFCDSGYSIVSGPPSSHN